MDSKKQCIKCREWKLLKEFYKTPSTSYQISYCNPCRREYQKEYRNSNKNEIRIKRRKKYTEYKEWRREYRKNNSECIKQASKEYYKNNKGYILKKSREWKSNNRDKIRATRRRYIKNRRESDSRFKLKTNISILIYQHLKRRALKKGDNSTFSFLPYMVDDLIKHLEGQFEPWMSWENYGRGKGKWTIDHIKPESSFNYLSIRDSEFQRCWALENLRPLEYIENIKKSNLLLKEY